MRHRVLPGDCLDQMDLLALVGDQFDAVVTDPPYELGFMGKKWDASGVAFDPETWRKALAVLKPGAHLAAFGGTRTFHRMTCAIEDAGFEIRDCLMWLYGQGMPKSRGHLKPAWEPIILARKPPAGTVAANVLQFGTGALNIDGCRVEPTGESRERTGEASQDRRYAEAGSTSFAVKPGVRGGSPEGRWPANVIHDGSPEVEAAFPDAPGQQGRARTDGAAQGNNVFGALRHETTHPEPRGDTGSASRFFYCAKAGAADRAGSKHPTVKPLALMRWLVTLITPPGGTLLDPFAGSGTTLQAARECGFAALGIEREDEYVADIRRRLAS